MKLKYSSIIKNMPFLFSESKKVASLICNGATKDEIIAQSLSQNIFQLDKERRRKELPSTLFNRLNSLPKSLLKVIQNGRIEESKLLVALSIMKTDRMFFEFMRDVYYDKFTRKQMILENKDFSIFFDSISEKDEKVSKWKPDNFDKLQAVYKRIVIEAGFGVVTDKVFMIIPPYVDEEIKSLIKENLDDELTRVFLLEV